MPALLQVKFDRSVLQLNQPTVTDPDETNVRTFTPEKLSQIYQNMLSNAIYGVAGTRLTVSSVRYLVDYMVVYNLAAHLAAFLQFGGQFQCPNQVRLGILAAQYKSAAIVEVLGLFHAPLNLEFTEVAANYGTPQRTDYYPPIFHAIANMDFATVQMLGRYHAIATVDRLWKVKDMMVNHILSNANQSNQDLTIQMFAFLHPIVTRTTANFHSEYNWGLCYSSIEAIISNDCDRLLALLLGYGLNAKRLFGPACGADIAARNGSLRCLQVLALNGVDLSYQPPVFCCKSLGIFFRLESESPLIDAQSENHQNCVEFLEAYIAAKDAGELNKFLDDMRAVPGDEVVSIANIEPVIAIPV